MVNEKAQVIERRGRNSNAQGRGGGTRSSGEEAVMATERRGSVIEFNNIKQL